MDDQINFFEKVESEKELGIQREDAFLQKAMPVLREVSKERNANPDDITSSNLELYSSIKFRSSLIAKIKLRGKKHYIAIPDRLKDCIPVTLKTTRIESEKQFSRIDFDLLTENTKLSIIENATLLAIERVPKEFDCCSRYEECSNAKVCVHPDPGFSMLCGYRRILKDGKVFYGTNRNID